MRRRWTGRRRFTGPFTATTWRLADLLLRSGADVQSGQPRRRRRRSFMASLYGNPAMIERLLKAGADAKERGPNGETMVMFAARNGNPAGDQGARRRRRRREREREHASDDGADVGRHAAASGGRQGAARAGSGMQRQVGPCGSPQKPHASGRSTATPWPTPARDAAPRPPPGERSKNRSVRAGELAHCRAPAPGSVPASPMAMPRPRPQPRGRGRGAARPRWSPAARCRWPRRGCRSDDAAISRGRHRGRPRRRRKRRPDAAGLCGPRRRHRVGEAAARRRRRREPDDRVRLDAAARRRATTGTTSSARFLLERGANANLANKGGWTPLYLATDNRNIEGGDYPVPKPDMDHLEYIKLLLDRGADVECARQGKHAAADDLHQSVVPRGRRDAVHPGGAVERSRADEAAAGERRRSEGHDGSQGYRAHRVGRDWLGGWRRLRAVAEGQHRGRSDAARPWRRPERGQQRRPYGADGRGAQGPERSRADAAWIVAPDSTRATRAAATPAIPRRRSRGAPGSRSTTPMVSSAFGVQSAVEHRETAALIRKLMTERGLPVPPANRTVDSICVVEVC